MSDQDNLRDRIAAQITPFLYWNYADWEDADERDKADARECAQAIIDELGLTIETQSLRWMDPNGPYPQSRVVGRWEDKATKNRVELRTTKRDGETVHQARYVDDPESYWHDISIVKGKATNWEWNN